MPAGADYCPPLLCSNETPAQTLHTALLCPAPTGHGIAGMSPEEAMELLRGREHPETGWESLGC